MAKNGRNFTFGKKIATEQMPKRQLNRTAIIRVKNRALRKMTQICQGIFFKLTVIYQRLSIW